MFSQSEMEQDEYSYSHFPNINMIIVSDPHSVYSPNAQLQPIQKLNTPPPPPAIDRKQRIKDFSNQLVKQSPKYIADNRFAVQIIQELTNAGICKLPQIINGRYQDLQEQIIKFDKDFLQEQKNDHSLQKSIFFINLQPLQIDFQDDEIIYKQTFQTLETPNPPKENYQYLIEILNLTIRQLDSSFFPDFKLIVNMYIQYKDKGCSNDTILNHMLEIYDQFSYIQKWDEMKTRNKPILVIYKQIKILEKRDEINDRRSLKVKQKHNKKIEKLQKRLYQEQILDPIEFLLQNLFEIFDEILKYYEENINQKTTQVVKKKTAKKKQEIKEEKIVNNQDYGLQKKIKTNSEQ